MVNVFVPTALKLGCLTAVPLATAEMAEVADMAVIVWRWTGRGGEFSPCSMGTDFLSSRHPSEKIK